MSFGKYDVLLAKPSSLIYIIFSWYYVVQHNGVNFPKQTVPFEIAGCYQNEADVVFSSGVFQGFLFCFYFELLIISNNKITHSVK